MGETPERKIAEMADQVVGTTTTETVKETFEQWLEKQPDDVKAMFTTHVTGLKTALDKERKSASDGEKAQKRLLELEAQEARRAEAALTKEQLMEKQTADARAQAEKQASDYKAQAEKVSADAEAKLIKAAVLIKAKDMGFENPADAYDMARVRDVLKSIKTKDDGEYDEALIEAALKPLIGRLPVKQQGSGNGTPQLRKPQPVEKDKAVAKIKTRY
jgi:serine phosphatase RsbU (regulator of sigma subunit)